MKIFEQRLSTLQSGMPVIITDNNGRLLSGIVCENDGTESLSLKIISTVYLRYSQIAQLEEGRSSIVLPSSTVISTPEIKIAAPLAESVKPEISIPLEKEKDAVVPCREMYISCSEKDIKSTFKNMSSDIRRLMSPAYDKLQNSIKNHDKIKLNEAEGMIWSVMKKNGFETEISVNNFYGSACLLNGNYYSASESFYYAEDIKRAVFVAMHGAKVVNDTVLYSMAAAFASIYIVLHQTEDVSEMADIVKQTAVICKDISGIRYIASEIFSVELRTVLDDMIRFLGENNKCHFHDATDHSECFEALQYFYQNSKIASEIQNYKPEKNKIKDTAAAEAQNERTEKKEWCTGKLKKYNFFEQTGLIEDSDGDTFCFELDDIEEGALKKKIAGMTSAEFVAVDLTYKLTQKHGNTYAVDIKKYVKTSDKNINSVNINDVNSLFAHGFYEKAIEAASKKLDSPDFENAFNIIICSYMPLWNTNGDLGYSEKLRKLIDKYKDREFTSEKIYKNIIQCYNRLHEYSKSLDIINRAMEACDSCDHDKMLYYLFGKAHCYRQLKDLPSAISQLQEWVDIVKKYKISDKYTMRDKTVFPTLVELYCEAGDYENLKKYVSNSYSKELKNIYLNRIKYEEEKKNEDITKVEAEDTTDDISEEYDEENNSDGSGLMTLKEAYDLYSDTYKKDRLKINDETAIEKIKLFDREHLYSLLTWLTAAADIQGNDESSEKSVLAPELSTWHALLSIEGAFSYAYDNPLRECEYSSSKVVNIYEVSKKLNLQYNEGLMMAAFLRTLFCPSSGQDYYLDDLVCAAKDADISSEYPMIADLLSLFEDFYYSTGYSVDSFAGYRSNEGIIEKVLSDANELYGLIDSKSGVREKEGRMRKLRDLMFSDEKSDLRICLDIVAENDVAKFEYVRSKIKELFIRSNRPVTVENTDIIKLDGYVDKYWDIARDIILNEGRHVSRPHDKIKGSSRTNIICMVKKIISVVCDWLAVAEHLGSNEEYIKKNYEKAAPQIISMLEELSNKTSENMIVNGFDWGTDSIYTTAKELLAKMNGTYSVKERKYFYIDFLRGENVLLNDDFLPEIQSTFCGFDKNNILSRIESDALEFKRPFEERISEILSDNETKHNFRSIRLIMSYGEDTGKKEISEHKDLEHLNECLKQAKQRFESMYQDFVSEMELYENYGTVSDINGDKSAFLQIALDWFRITRITTDYGFYALILDSIRKNISENAAEHGNELVRQLEDLADKPGYDFGIYTKENVLSLIDDQNFTSAEFILNCIRRNDTKAVFNYSNEPFGYFSEFVSEHATDYRAVFGAGKSVVDTIAEYSGKKDLEKALIYLTNNARKETKGGSEILKSWMPMGGPAKETDLEKLLLKFGFDPISLVSEPDCGNIECYRVCCRKRKGKVTYPHSIPAFGSGAESEGFRVACLYGKFDCNSLMDSFRTMNAKPVHTLVLLDYAMNMEERRKLARLIKEEKTFAKTFIVVDRVILFYLAKHYTADTVSKRLMAVTLPFAYYQPFVEASRQTMPPELFTGREAELTSIESPEGCSLVYGGRQLGKSALLKMAEKHVDRNGNGDRAVLLDIQFKNYKETALLLSKELVAREILDGSCICDNWDDLAMHIKKRLMDDDPATRINYLLIMLDEADEFIRSSSEDNNPPIAAIKNLPAGRFKLVMAGLHNLSRFNREILQGNSNLMHLSSVVIKQFQRPEAIKLLTNTLAYLGFRFDEKVISLILAKTNYYPGLIQFYCQKLLEAMKGDDYAGYSEINTPYYEVSEQHIKSVLSDRDFMTKVNEKLEGSLFTEEKGRSFYHAIALIVAFLYYEKPDEKKYTADEIVRISEEYKISRIANLDREKLNEFLSEMWDLNVLSREDEYYRFATEGFRELLGSRETVENEMSKYMEEGEE